MKPIEEPRLCRAIRKTVDFLYPKMELVGTENIPDTPCILVGNHAQAHGAIIAEIRLPFDHYTWCAFQMLCREEVADYAYADFWSEKPGCIRWLYRIVSRLIPIPAAYIFSHARTIPVYRDSRCLTTFRTSLRKLESGYHLVIFPEQNVPHNGIVWEFQDRFIDVARLYYKQYGKQLEFVPMYLAPSLRKVIFGQGTVFSPAVPIVEERKRICTYLMDAITRIAAEQPLHTVIPYPNLPRRRYPKNQEANGNEAETI